MDFFLCCTAVPVSVNCGNLFTSSSSCSFWSLKLKVDDTNCFKMWWFSVFLFSLELVMVLTWLCLGLVCSCAIPLKGGMFLAYLNQVCILSWILCWVMYGGSAIKGLSHSVLLPVCDESIIYMMKICHITMKNKCLVIFWVVCSCVWAFIWRSVGRRQWLPPLYWN